MSRENEFYRDTLADIIAVCGKRVLSVADVMHYTGLCRETVVKRYGKGDIPATVLARLLTKKGGGI